MSSLSKLSRIIVWTLNFVKGVTHPKNVYDGVLQGEVDRLKVEGTMNVKNLLQCHARLRIAVNEDLQICRPGEVRGR